jgi:hypothetical protein
MFLIEARLDKLILQIGPDPLQFGSGFHFVQDFASIYIFIFFYTQLGSMQILFYK